jgi:hypothetical protein
MIKRGERIGMMHRETTTTNTGPPRRGRRRTAFSYVEAVISVVILGMAMSTGMRLYGMYAQGTRLDIERSAAHQLCVDLMTEILSKDFEDSEYAPGSFGKGTGEDTRREFDDVDDYDYWIENPPQSLDGTPMPGEDYANMARIVVVWNVDEEDLTSVAADGSTAVKMIAVAVVKDSKELCLLRGMKARYPESNDE